MHFTYRHSLSPEEVVLRSKSLAESLTKKFSSIKLDVKEFSEENSLWAISVSSSYFESNILLRNSDIDIKATMKGFLANMFAARAKTEIQNVLLDTFGPEPEILKEAE